MSSSTTTENKMNTNHKGKTLFHQGEKNPFALSLKSQGKTQQSKTRTNLDQKVSKPTCQ